MNYTVEIAADVIGIPHSFIIVKDEAGKIVYARGFAPEVTGLWGEGHISNDWHESTTSSGTLAVLDEQGLAHLKDIIEGYSLNPPYYNLLLGSQCTVWSLRVLKDANILSFAPNTDFSMPLVDIMESLVFNPYTQAAYFALKDMVLNTIVPATDAIINSAVQTTNANEYTATVRFNNGASQTQTTTYDTNNPSSSKSILEYYDANGNVINKSVSYSDGINTYSSALFADSKSTINNLLDTENQLSKLNSSGAISNSFYDVVMKWNSDYLVSNISTPVYAPVFPDIFLPTLDPIGAFYESTTLATDNALSIADKTYVLLGSNMKGLSVAALSALDTNHDNKLSGNELSSLNAWVDTNEDGIAQSTEIRTLSTQGISHKQTQDNNYTRVGNNNNTAPSCVVVYRGKSDKQSRILRREVKRKKNMKRYGE